MLNLTAWVAIPWEVGIACNIENYSLMAFVLKMKFTNALQITKAPLEASICVAVVADKYGQILISVSDKLPFWRVGLYLVWLLPTILTLKVGKQNKAI